MKIRYLIEVLRCSGDHRVACEKCNSLDTCKKVIHEQELSVLGG